MLSNLKVRTGILLVLGTFLLALLVSNGAAWLAMYSSNDKLDRVNSVYSNQVTPLYEAYTLLQRSRLDLGAAIIELQEGRLRESGQFLGRARSAGEAAGKSMDAFSKIEKTPELQEKASAVQSAYQRYASQAGRQADALGRQDIRGFIDQNTSTQTDGGVFDGAVSAYLEYVDARTDRLVVDAGSDYMLSKTVSIALLVISVLLSVLCWMFMQRSLLRPLNHAGQHFDKIAAGDLTARVEVRNSNEVGQLFGALKRMQENLARTVSQVRRGV
ncbi:Tar ligand binding domain-containing protein, partial [Bordetella sp. BOR01]|uniref:Tar ligand binding domain-containing protein n=1 Tax=Bordetella sp. BOR01 TaxID=2854779 RepID=UPI001C4909F3